MEQIRSLEALEYDLKQNCSLRTVEGYWWLACVDCFISNLEQRSESFRASSKLVSSVEDVGVESAEKELTNTIFVLLEDLFEGGEDSEESVGYGFGPLHEVLEDLQDVVFKSDLRRVGHELEDGDEAGLQLSSEVLDIYFTFCKLLQNVDAPLYKDAASVGAPRHVRGNSLDNRLSEVYDLIFDVRSEGAHKVPHEFEVVAVGNSLNALLNQLDKLWQQVCFLEAGNQILVAGNRFKGVD